MGIYLIAIIICILSLALKLDKKKGLKKIWLIIMFLFLTGISAFRHFTVGTDTLQYYSSFKIISNLGWNQFSMTRFETGYYMLNKLIAIISKDPQVFLAITSCMIIPVVGVFIYKYSKNVAYSTLLYILLNIYFFHMTGLRQSLAITILLLSVFEIREKHNIKFILLVLLASLFHSSAIIFLLVLFFNKYRYNEKSYVYILLITFGCFVFFKPVFLFIANILGKYSGYVNSDDFGVSNFFGAFFQFLLTFSVYSFCHILYVKKLKNGDQVIENSLFIKLLSLDVVCQCMAMKMNIIGRMNQYFWIYAIILIPNLINEVKKSKNRFALYLGMLVVTLVYWLVLGIYRPEWNGAIPYSIFTN